MAHRRCSARPFLFPSLYVSLDHHCESLRMFLFPLLTVTSLNAEALHDAMENDVVIVACNVSKPTFIFAHPPWSAEESCAQQGGTPFPIAQSDISAA